MGRRVVVAVLVCLLVSGCATTQTGFPPGQDPETLVAAINNRAQGTPVVEPEPPPVPPSVQIPVVKTTVKVGESCLLIGGIGTAGFIGLLCHGNPSISASDIGESWKAIWSDD